MLRSLLSRALFPALQCLLALALISCHSESSTKIHFVDTAADAGLDFTHKSGAAGAYFLIETMGAGAAFFDYDDDGHIDLYLVNGFDLDHLNNAFAPVNFIDQDEQYYLLKHPKEYMRPVDPYGQVDSLVYRVHPAPLSPPIGNRLYRNQGDGTFVDVTEKAGVGDTGYGMGCAVGDYDNDGDLDLYVTNYGPNTLYANNGDGTFSNVTDHAHVGNAHWSTSAAFIDYDGDGHLDLYVVNYLDFHPGNNQICGGIADSRQTATGTLLKMLAERRTYCSPIRYNGAPDVLYRNQGDGTFADVSRRTGVYNLTGKGLGIAPGDYDNDGHLDLYVANDGVGNHLQRNKAGRYFVHVGLEAGVAFNAAGRSEAGMGTDWGDYDNDGDLDLFVTNFALETNTLYRNEGNGRFIDATEASGLAQPSFNPLGFGTFFFDADNDGDLDLFVANGHVQDRVHLFKGKEHLTHAQTNQLFENTNGHFTDISAAAGPALRAFHVSRGASPADYDNDGDLDIVVTNSNGPVQLLRNDLSAAAHWLSVRLRSQGGNRDAIGAHIRLTCNKHTQIRTVHTSSSYLSAGDLRQHFGLGTCDRVDLLEIRWPNGSRQQLHDVSSNQFLTVEEPVH